MTISFDNARRSVLLRAAVFTSVWSSRASRAANSRNWQQSILSAGSSAVPESKRQGSNGTKADRVRVADFLDSDTPNPEQASAAVQAALNSGAAYVSIDRRYRISKGIQLVANQVVDFDGGSLVAVPNAEMPQGLLYATAKGGIQIIGAVIDAGATKGIRGISLRDCVGASVSNFKLIKCSLALEASGHANQIGYRVNKGVIDMRGWRATSCYVSACNDVSISDLEMVDGLEGVGIYNHARNVRQSNCISRQQSQDGFVIIAGQHVSYTACTAYACGQSGFTTQRQSSGEDTRYVSYAGCQAYDNKYDGFDMRGANAEPWNVDIMVNATGCSAKHNKGTGFYIVNSEGSAFTNCISVENKKQNFFVNRSDRVTLSNCESLSGAAAIEAGANKAGILVYNARSVFLEACTSSNANDVTQDYGLSFTGSSSGCQVIGGVFENNAVAPYVAGSGNVFIPGPPKHAT